MAFGPHIRIQNYKKSDKTLVILQAVLKYVEIFGPSLSNSENEYNTTILYCR